MRTLLLVRVDELPIEDLLASLSGDFQCIVVSSLRANVSCRQDVSAVVIHCAQCDRRTLHAIELLRRQLRHVKVFVLSVKDSQREFALAIASGAEQCMKYPSGNGDLAAALRSLANTKAKRPKKAKLLQKGRSTLSQANEIALAQEETIHRLVQASLFRDYETGMHVRRTGLYCEVIAAGAGWSVDRIRQIRLAAPMHDLGKIGIPDAILRKCGPLSDAEHLIMQRHTVIGADLLAGSNAPVLQMAYDIALCHHERWDGSGYPQGLRGEEIPEEARIVAIADVFDALSHDRAYRLAFNDGQVEAMMNEGRGRYFDPYLLDVVASHFPEMWAIAKSLRDEMSELNESETDYCQNLCS